MRIVFDQGTPVPMRRYLASHSVATAFELGWSELNNGALLTAAEAEFDALITTDQHLHHQDTLNRDGLLSINIRRFISDSNKRLRLYKQGLLRIESRPEILSGAEVFKGTPLSVRHIGAMLHKGVTVEAIKADYPALTIDDIRFAEIYAVVKRPPGRPTKPITFRSNPLD